LDLLAPLTSLKFLDVGHADLEGPGILSVLTALTQLSYLVLPFLDDSIIQSDADAAAVTASPQLQLLNITVTWLTADKCRHLFPAGRQLTKLSASLDLIRDGRAAALVAACCPNLKYIILSKSLDSARVVAEHGFADSEMSSMLVCWQSLQHLTSLTLDVWELPVALPDVWRALACLAQLRVLKISTNLWHLPGVLNPTSCTRLRSLSVDAISMGDVVEERVCFDVTGEEVHAGGLQCGFVRGDMRPTISQVQVTFSAPTAYCA
jgi:hypothetical protein